MDANKRVLTLEDAKASKYADMTDNELRAFWKAWGPKFLQLQRKATLNETDWRTLETLWVAKLILEDKGETLVDFDD